MKGRLQFRHDNEVYGSFAEIERLLNAAAENGNLEVLIGEPYVFHYNEDGKLKTVLAIGDKAENGLSRESKYALIDIDRVMGFVSKDSEIIDAIDSLGKSIRDLGIASASIGTVSGETEITLHRAEGSDAEDIVIPLTEFRNDISDEISEAAEETLRNAEDYADGILESANTYTDSAIATVNEGMGTLQERISSVEDGKVDKEDGKTLSSNDYTDEEKAKLAGIESGAQRNIIEKIRVNGIPVGADSAKAVDIEVPFSSVSSEDKILSLRNGVLSSIFNAEYDSDAKKIYFKGKDGIDICPPIDASSFIKDGMIRDVDIVTENGIKYLKIVFNSDAGERVIKIPVTDLVTEYTVSGGSENFLSIDNFKIGIKVGENGLATERSVTDQIHSLDDKYSAITHDIVDTINELSNTVIGEGFDGETITHKVQALENAIGSIDITSGLTDVYAKIREVSGKTTDNERDIRELSGSVVTLSSGLTSLSGNVSDISEDVRALSGTVSEISDKVDDLSDTLSGLSQDVDALSGTVEDIDSRLSNIEDGDGGKITVDITDKDGNVIVHSGATTTEAVEAIIDELDKRSEDDGTISETIYDGEGNVLIESGTSVTTALTVILQYYIDDEEVVATALNDLNSRLVSIEEEGSKISGLEAADDDISVEYSGDTVTIGVNGISNNEVIILDEEKTVTLSFSDGNAAMSAKTWGDYVEFVLPDTIPSGGIWKIDADLSGVQADDELFYPGDTVTISNIMSADGDINITATAFFSTIS